MKCPSCKKKTISFFDWMNVLNAIRWQCPECDTKLKASYGTYFSLFATVLLASFPLYAHTNMFFTEVYDSLTSVVISAAPRTRGGVIMAGLAARYLLIK